MKINKRYILSFVAPFMIFISAIGLMGISIILEKGLRRKLDRKNILKKIKSYQKVK